MDPNHPVHPVSRQRLFPGPVRALIPDAYLFRIALARLRASSGRVGGPRHPHWTTIVTASLKVPMTWPVGDRAITRI